MNSDHRDRQSTIDALVEKNLQATSHEVETALVKLRLEQGRVLCDNSSPEEPAPAPTEDIFAGQLGLPEIKAEDLSGDALASGILQHGALLVRGLYRENHLATLKEIAATQEEANKGDNAPLSCTPHTLFHLLEVYRDSGLLQAVAEYMNTNPVLLAERVKLRHYRVENDAFAAIPWHQDVNFFGSRSFAVNCWAAVSSCGEGNPGLGILPRALEDRIGWSESDGLAPLDYANSIPKDVITKIVERTQPAYPVLQSGDALLFDEMTMHRTATKSWDLGEQLVTVSWFFRPSGFPDWATPIAL